MWALFSANVLMQKSCKFRCIESTCTMVEFMFTICHPNSHTATVTGANNTRSNYC